MKLEITSFVDYNRAGANTQIELMEHFQLKHVFVRKLNGKPLCQVDASVVDEFIYMLQNKKYVIGAFDPLINAYDPYDPASVVTYDAQLEKACVLAVKMKAQSIFYKVPRYMDITKDKDIIFTQIKAHIHKIKKYRLGIFLQMSDGHKPNEYKYILDELKDPKIKVIFDSIYMYLNKDADVTAFRLLRETVGVLIADDVDRLGNPRIIGRGDANITNLFKRFIQNEYSEYVLLDSKLPELIERTKKYNWLEKTFDKKKRLEIKIAYDFSKRTESDATRMTYKYHLTLLNRMFLNKKVSF